MVQLAQTRDHTLVSAMIMCRNGFLEFLITFLFVIYAWGAVCEHVSLPHVRDSNVRQVFVLCIFSYVGLLWRYYAVGGPGILVV